VPPDGVTSGATLTPPLLVSYAATLTHWLPELPVIGTVPKTVAPFVGEVMVKKVVAPTVTVADALADPAAPVQVNV
jgi:hypothetical protein